MNDVERIEVGTTIALPRGAAFERFTEGLGTWWPREYTWSGDALTEIRLGAHTGALCHEIGPHGFRCDWGRITAYEPPARVAFTWQIGPNREPVPDPTRASVVDVRFADHDGHTHVTLVHDRFGVHGAGARPYRDALASPMGWPLILERYAAVD